LSLYPHTMDFSQYVKQKGDTSYLSISIYIKNVSVTFFIFENKSFFYAAVLWTSYAYRLRLNRHSQQCSLTALWPMRMVLISISNGPKPAVCRRRLACRMGSHSIICHPIQMNPSLPCIWEEGQTSTYYCCNLPGSEASTNLYCLVNRGTCMWTTCPRSLSGSAPARSQTCNLKITSSACYRYTTNLPTHHTPIDQSVINLPQCLLSQLAQNKCHVVCSVPLAHRHCCASVLRASNARVGAHVQRVAVRLTAACILPRRNITNICNYDTQIGD